MIFRLLVALVLLAPLPFASVHQWSWGLMAAVTGGLLVAWAGGLLAGRQAPAVRLRSVWPLVLLFAVPVFWAALQTATWTPPAWHHSLWASAGQALGADTDGSVTLNPAATWEALARLLTYGGIFWLALQTCRDRGRAHRVIQSLAIAGFTYATYGLIVHFSGTDTILWYKKFAYLGDLTSTFVNRNSYATYAGLGLICASGLFLKMLSERPDAALGWKETLRWLIERAAGQGWLLILACAVLAMALLLTHSRGGFLSTALALVVLCLSLALTRQAETRHAVTAAMIAVALGAGVFAIGGEITDQRLNRIVLAQDERPRLYELTLNAIGDFPLTGTGYGTYKDVFPAYRTERVYSVYHRAHNTYLENALELGLPAAGALFAAIGGLGVLCLMGLRRRRRDAIYPAIGLAATVLVAAHSVVDFSLQIPAVAVTYSLLMGAACAQSWRSRGSA